MARVKYIKQGRICGIVQEGFPYHCKKPKDLFEFLGLERMQ